MSEAIGQFRAAIYDAGLSPPEVIEADGKVHRFSTNGRPKDDAGWYVFHEDGIPAGAFGDWRTDLKQTWHAKIDRKLSAHEMARHRARSEAMRRQRGAEEAKLKAEAREKAAAIWQTARPAPDNHDYLLSKDVKAHRLRVHDGALVVPLRDGAELHSLQFIEPDGDKRFLIGGRVSGCYFSIGEPDGVLCIAEGYATGASIYEATGHATAVAFNAGNLLPVARALRQRFPALRLILCGDDDYKTEGNPGLTKAREAAQAVDGLLAVPDFGTNRPEGGTDFNDLHRHAGPNAVCSCIERAEEIKHELPDLSVLRLHRRPPPGLPLEVFGAKWSGWILDTAAASACPPDYVVAALLSSASTMIGNARWAQATPGWSEPPHLWCAAVGDSGQGKSPGADVIFRSILPVMEARMTFDFPVRMQQHQAQAEIRKARIEVWQKDVRDAQKKGAAPPPAPDLAEEPEPMAPRLMQSDVTIEKVAALLAGAAPKGILMARDELAGFLLGMNAYNDGARAFWLEAYGGRPFRVDRVKHPQPILVPHLVVAWHGGIQPSRLAQVIQEVDDGLLARFCWFWPDPVPFRLARAVPNIDFAVDAFDCLRKLEMTQPIEPGLPNKPMIVALTENGRALMEQFGREMQVRQETAGGLFVSALGKARGLALRLALVIEYLWWAGGGTGREPNSISDAAFLAAAALVGNYLMPMAERMYGDASATRATKNAATLARWIIKHRPPEVHVRTLQREVRLPGLGEAESIHEACNALIEAGWLYAPPRGGRDGRARAAYAVRPEVWAAVQ